MIRIKSGAVHSACEKAQVQMAEDLCHFSMEDCKDEILQDVKLLGEVIEKSKEGFCINITYKEYQMFRNFIS